MSQEHEDQTLKYLLGGRTPQWRKDSTDSSKFPAVPAPRPHSAHRVPDSDLRDLGFNYREREKLRRGSRDRRPRQVDKKKARLRFEHYIDQRVGDWSTTGLDRDVVVAQWADLVDHDVDAAEAWWNRGVSPLQIRQVAEFVDNGLTFRDLNEDVQGKTLLEHLLAGTSVRWCVLALDSKHRRS